MITLRRMTQQEYDQLDQTLWENYAQERARNSGTTIEEERAISQKQRSDLLPNGLATPAHHFWTLEDAPGHSVGILWVFVKAEKQQAFIYDIEIDAEQRGKGYGRQALEALDALAPTLGVNAIELNVFGDNEVAMALYNKAGYRTVATYMRKEL